MPNITPRLNSKLKQTNTGIDFYLAVVAARETLMVHYRCNDMLVTRALRAEIDAQNLKNDAAFVEHTREPDSRTQLSMQFELWYRKNEREHTTITSMDILDMIKSKYISNDVIQSLKIKLMSAKQKNGNEDLHHYVDQWDIDYQRLKSIDSKGDFTPGCEELKQSIFRGLHFTSIPMVIAVLGSKDSEQVKRMSIEQLLEGLRSVSKMLIDPYIVSETSSRTNKSERQANEGFQDQVMSLPIRRQTKNVTKPLVEQITGGVPAFRPVHTVKQQNFNLWNFRFKNGICANCGMSRHVQRVGDCNNEVAVSPTTTDKNAGYDSG